MPDIEPVSRWYRGRYISPCCWAEGEHKGKWIIQTWHHPTGIPWEDQHCPHYWTLQQTQEAIRREDEEGVYVRDAVGNYVYWEELA